MSCLLHLLFPWTVNVTLRSPPLFSLLHLPIILIPSIVVILVPSIVVILVPSIVAVFCSQCILSSVRFLSSLASSCSCVRLQNRSGPHQFPWVTVLMIFGRIQAFAASSTLTPSSAPFGFSRNCSPPWSTHLLCSVCSTSRPLFIMVSNDIQFSFPHNVIHRYTLVCSCRLLSLLLPLFSLGRYPRLIHCALHAHPARGSAKGLRKSQWVVVRLQWPGDYIRCYKTGSLQRSCLSIQ